MSLIAIILCRAVSSVATEMAMTSSPWKSQQLLATPPLGSSCKQTTTTGPLHRFTTTGEHLPSLAWRKRSVFSSRRKRRRELSLGCCRGWRTPLRASWSTLVLMNGEIQALRHPAMQVMRCCTMCSPPGLCSTNSPPTPPSCLPSTATSALGSGTAPTLAGPGNIHIYISFERGDFQDSYFLKGW